NREVRTPCDTTTHYHCNLGNPHATHLSVVSKVPAKVFLVWETFILHWKINPGTIYKIYNRQSIFNGYFLRTKVFLSRYRPPLSSLYCSMIRFLDILLSAYITHLRHSPTRGATTMLLIHLISRQGGNFNCWRIFI